MKRLARIASFLGNTLERCSSRQTPSGPVRPGGGATGRTPRAKRWPRAPLALWLALLTTFLSACGSRPDISSGVQLVFTAPEVGPTTTFELRFDDVMVRPQEIGVEAAESPLVVSPDLHGRFTWLSQRSGVFTPDEPPTLNTAYRLTLRAGLRRADGQPSRAQLQQTLRTPPFRVTASLPREASPNAGATPEVKLLFNAPVSAAAAHAYAVFRNATGRTMEAEVRQGTEEERPLQYELGGAPSLETWRGEFFHARRRQVRSTEGTNPVPNLLLVTPRKPLSVGQGWRLVLSRGLPANQGSLRLRAAFAVPIGDVTPFLVTASAAHNQLHDGKRLDLWFSKPVSSELIDTLGEWITVTPRPANLSLELSGSRVELRGGFHLGTNYTLVVRAGLPAEEPFMLERGYTNQLQFEPVPPRLYFPEFSGEQLAEGSREFRLITVNVPHVRVRAKLLELPTLIHALRGYAGYFKSAPGWISMEPYQGVDFNLVPGRTIFEKEFPITADTDAASVLALDWDDLLAGRRAGVVFLEAERARHESGREPRLGTQALMQLTDLGVVWKSAASHVTAYVFSHSSGKPLPGVALRLASDENEFLADAAQTDAHGLATLPAPTNAHWLVAQRGEDFHAVPLHRHNIPLYSFHLPVAWDRDAEPERKMILFSDRAVYRPGETLHLKAIAREWRDDRLMIPTNRTGTLRCTDARGREFFETNLALSALGSWDISLALPQGPLGLYTALLNVAGHEYWHSFLVQEFQANAFEVALKARPNYFAGDRIEVPVSARYFFGKDLSRAQVRWSAQAEDAEFRPAGFSEFTFGAVFLESHPERGPSSQSLQGEAVLTDKTGLVLAPDLTVNALTPQPRKVELLAEVTDLNQQTISRAAEFTLHASEFYLGWRATETVTVAGQPLPLELVAVRANGQPWPEPVKATLRLQRVDWNTVRLEGAAHRRAYRSEPTLTNLLERDIVVKPATIRRSDSPEETVVGTTISDLLATNAGAYVVEVRATDPAGRAVLASARFYVSETTSLAWDYRNEAQIDLVPNQTTYQAGQTAEILVKTPLGGDALVTVERESVRRSFIVHLEGNAPLVRVPVEAGDAPNVFVSVIPIRGASDSPKEFKMPEYRVGYCQLTVDDPRSQLVVRVEPAATNYLPGAEVRIAAVVKDSTGAPAAEAEVTLWAVDEGVLSLTEYAVPDPHAVFFEARRLAVWSGISLPFLLNEDPEQQNFRNKGYLIGDGGRERLQKNFLPCAAWFAALRTDQDGRISVQFTAPDSLTRYRIIAVAHTARNQFGRGQSGFEISKPLMLEPALPRFANVTDRVLARAVVHNQTAEPGYALVTLELDGKAGPDPFSADRDEAGGASVPASRGGRDPRRLAGTLAPPAQFMGRRHDGQARENATDLLSRTVSVAAHGSAAIEFPLAFTATGPAKWIWRARFADASDSKLGTRNPKPFFTDSVQSTIEVGHVAPLLREILLGRVTTTETNLLAHANPQLLEGEGRVTVVVANTRLSELGEAASQLLHYPYGCVEQTSSSLLPWIVLRHSPAARFLRQCPSEIDQAIRAGVTRLFSMQTSSGGLGYWPRDREPMLWGSAYAGVVLALAARQGAALPKEDFDKLLSYLSSELRDTARDAGWHDRCLGLYALALAGKAEPAYHEAMFQKREKLSAEDRALLALAVLETKGPAEMVDELLKLSPTARVAGDDGFGCSARVTALRLLAWTLHRPGDAIVDQLVTDLMGGRQQAHWLTTQGNAWALLSLTEYAARVEGQLGAAEGTLTFGAESVPFKLSAQAAVFEHTFKLGSNATATPLRLANSTPSRLFTQVQLETRSKVTHPPRQDRGFGLQRSFARLDDDNQPQELQNLRVGDRVLVTLRLSVREPARYLVIDDALPSVFEAINPEFKTQRSRTALQPPPPGGSFDDPWFSNFRELRTDRALFFRNEVPPGNYSLRYLARVRAAGVVTAPPAKVEEMYHPERCGLTEAVSVEAKPLP
ncbi:MAG: hypothetical protein HZA90_25450 [Verrucomicrobia bacterium]|nr:hypothetical protein [Verrucomicrobiota bacterium]